MKMVAGPDAALHGILLPVLVTAQPLKSDFRKARMVAQVRVAIARFLEYFDSPG